MLCCLCVRNVSGISHSNLEKEYRLSFTDSIYYSGTHKTEKDLRIIQQSLTDQLDCDNGLPRDTCTTPVIMNSCAPNGRKSFNVRMCASMLN